MPQIINTNISSLTAQRNLNSSQSANQTSLERLSSGLRINSAKDDAAGLAISTRFSSQIRGLGVAIRNAGDGISLAQTAEGALGSMTDNLQRIRELSLQASNGTNSDTDRQALNAEAQQLIAEITRTADETNFNGSNLLDGSFSSSFQIGAGAGETLSVSIGELTAEKLGASKSAGVSAIGTSSALSNGDLSINGVAITASVAGSDTFSTNNNEASAISKVAAINASSDETGVSAVVDTNLVAGSDMTAASGTTTMTLNGVAISLQTTADTSTSRSAVIDAINAVSAQTGVTAVNTGADETGVQLQAADGRNIQVAYTTGGGGTEFGTNAAVQAATGLNTEGTFEGGFTLVADSDVSEVVVTGGDGTGNGDITNSGLSAGTFSAGTASIVSTAQTSTQSATQAGVAATVGAAVFASAEDISYSVTVGDGTATVGVAAGGAGATMAALADALDTAVTGASFYEQIDLTTTGGVTSTVGQNLTIATIAVTMSGTTADSMADDINGTDFSAQNISVSATSDGTNVTLSIQNYSATSVSIDGAAATTMVFADDTVDAAGNFLHGQLAFVSDNGEDVSLTLSESTGTSSELFDFTAATSVSSSYTGVNGLSASDLSVNGVNVTAATGSVDTASATQSSDGFKILSSEKELSGIAVAAAINSVSEETGVSATTNATSVVGGDGSNTVAAAAGFSVGDAADIYINGVSVGSVTLQDDGTGAVDTARAKTDAIDAINLVAGQTGVTAEDNGVSITLTAADGRNVSVAIDDQAGESLSIGAVMGLDAAVAGIGESTFGENSNGAAANSSAEAITYETTYSTVSLSSAGEITIAGANADSELTATGFEAGTFGGAATGQFLNDIDISTAEGAQKALAAIDNALDSVNAARADLGAIQNRFESTISNLSVSVENLQAANSRILDADFAAETAELSRTQVLQQAGISILAQANAAPQQVLALLQ